MNRKTNHRLNAPRRERAAGFPVRAAALRMAADLGMALAAAAVFGAFFFLGRIALEKVRGGETFRLHTIAVEGNKKFTRDEILRASGLGGKASIFDVNPGAVKELMERNRWIRAVDVKRIFPDAVKITVEERVMAASLLVGETLYHVDRDGVIFEKHPPDQPLAGLLVTGFDEESVTADRESVEEEVRKLLQFADLYRRMGLERYAPIGELRHESGGALVVYTAGDAREIRLGAGTFLRKTKNLRTVFEFLEKEKRDWAYILFDADQFPDRAVAKLK